MKTLESEVIRAMVRVVNPEIGETVYDPGCGTGGFSRSHEYMRAHAGEAINAVQLATLKHRIFYGREQDNADFAGKLQTALESARPHREQAATLTAEAKTLEGEWAARRKAKTAPLAELREREERWRAKVREARDAEAKAVT